VPCVSTWNRLKDHRTSIAKLRILSAQQDRLPHFNATVAKMQLQGSFLEQRNCTSASTNSTKQFLAIVQNISSDSQSTQSAGVTFGTCELN
jgi:hypothetical protein